LKQSTQTAVPSEPTAADATIPAGRTRQKNPAATMKQAAQNGVPSEPSAILMLPNLLVERDKSNLLNLLRLLLLQHLLVQCNKLELVPRLSRVILQICRRRRIITKREKQKN
jgi:hypothetical protein